MAGQKTTQTWRSAAVLTFVTTLIINAMAASTEILGGVTTKEVSDLYDTLFTPAGFTFTIWSVIYSLLIIFVLRMLCVWKVKKPGLNDATLLQVTKLFTYTNIVNVAWMLAWQYQVMWLTVPLMLTLLALLIKIHGIMSAKRMPLGELFALRAPFSIYFGWITVATIANITVFLTSISWTGGLSPEAWMLIIPAIGAIVGLTVALTRRDWLYITVFAWAYNGIAARYIGSNTYNEVEWTLRLWIAIFVATAVALLVYQFRLLKKIK